MVVERVAPAGGRPPSASIVEEAVGDSGNRVRPLTSAAPASTSGRRPAPAPPCGRSRPARQHALIFVAAAVASVSRSISAVRLTLRLKS